ncbi:MAG: DUF969 domain-containing protein [Acidobacteria bacterium]|nr:DUF969 domain-containing protein [Acidobacteriota bacterium]
MEIRELFKLAGILIVVIGLALRLRTTLVVVTAGLVTGLAAGMPLFSNEGIFTGMAIVTSQGKTGLINMLGKAFADNRLMTLFIITLPAIGLSEKFGLQRQAGDLIGRIKAATVGRLQITYQLFRVLHGALGIRLNGHPSFVRPLIFPMSVGAMQAKAGSKEVPDELIERIKASNAASENYGNFYGQNLSPVQAGILLVYGVMQGLGFTISIWDLVLFTSPVVVASIIFAIIQFRWLDRRLDRGLERQA